MKEVIEELEAWTEAGDRVALTYSFGPHVQFWAAKEGLEEVGAMAIALGGMGSTQRLQTIDEVGATAIWCRDSRSSSAGSTGAQRLWSAAAPWINTSGGPSPLRQTAIGVPSREKTFIGSALTDLLRVGGVAGVGLDRVVELGLDPLREDGELALTRRGRGADEGGIADDGSVERDDGGHAVDDELVEGAA